jgi:uncharacterized protein
LSCDECRLFYVADIHGSERCYRKWLNAAAVYRADAILIGGDIAGKLIIPITDHGGGRYTCVIHGDGVTLDGTEELERLRRQLRASGRYVVVLTAEEKREYDSDPEKVEGELWPRVVAQSVEAWVALAEERLAPLSIPAFVMLGNDDFPELAPLLDGDHVQNVEDKVTELPGGFEMISLGYSNRTPWSTPRELDESDLATHINAMADRLRDPATSVFNLHCPPYDSGLDEAPILDSDFRPQAGGGGIRQGPVGSTAVRSALESYQPMLGLHGHIHESPGGIKLGRTIAINPGSDYGDGVLRGAIVTLSRRKGVRSWQLVQG